jgi:hypothetical protein
MIEALAASPDLLAKLMQSVASQSAAAPAAGANELPQMPPSMVGMQPSAGGMNPQAMQAALQGGAPEGFMTGNMPELGGGVNNIPQELASMGYTPPPEAASPSLQERFASANFAAEAPPEHHALAQSTAQYVPLQQAQINSYGSAVDNMGLMELLAKAKQMA